MFQGLKIPKDGGSECQQCHMKIYAVTTPRGGEYLTCPLCTRGCKCCFMYDKDDPIYNKLYEINKKLYSPDNIQSYGNHYCSYCHILFDAGCVHGVNGCTEDVYNGLLVKNYKLRNDPESIVYEGMIFFESFKQYVDNIANIDVELKCMCDKNNLICANAYYPDPEEYENCTM
jgi:hypothetical protein